MIVRMEGGPLGGLDLRVSAGDERSLGNYIYTTLRSTQAAPLIDISALVVLPEVVTPVATGSGGTEGSPPVPDETS